MQYDFQMHIGIQHHTTSESIPNNGDNPDLDKSAASNYTRRLITGWSHPEGTAIDVDTNPIASSHGEPSLQSI